MRKVWLGVAALGVGLVGAAAHAEPAPPLSVLLGQADVTAPRLAESAAEVSAAQGRADQAGVRPNPTVGLEVENFAGSRPYQGLSNTQTTISASQTIELGGKRAARVASGQAGVAAAEAQARQARAQFAYDVVIAYATAEAAQAKAGLLLEDLGRAQEDLRAARALVEAGKEADLRAVQAQAAATGVQAELEGVRADAAEALVRLSALVGHTPAYTALGPPILNRTGALRLPVEPADLATPAVAAAEAERDAAARRVAVERVRAVPDITVSLGARRLQGERATALVGGVSAPLPLFDKNRGAIGAAQAELTAAEVRVRAARLDAEADWRAAAGRALAAQTGLSAALDAETAAAEAYRLSRLGYEGGKTPLVEVLAARRGLTEAQLRTLEARTQRLRAEAALARLAGTALGE